MLDSVRSFPELGPGTSAPDPEAEVPNIGTACSDAICARGLSSKVALRWIPRDGERESITYGQLAAESSRFANVLGTLGYLQQPEATAGKFTGAYYDSGDRAHRDADGYYWFAGRADDVINTAGHPVSPFEVESALLERPEVAESAAIAAPDDILFEEVVAFVVLRPGIEPSTRLSVDLRIAVSNRVSTYGAPRDLVFVSGLPNTKSGKLMRRLLRARYFGLPEGDLSSLED